MKARIIVAFAAVVLGVGTSFGAQAQQAPYFGLMATYLVPSDVREGESRFPAGHLVLGWPLHDYANWTLELGGYYAELEPDVGGGNDELWHFGADLVRRWSPWGRLEPFVLAGLGAAYEDIGGDDDVHPSVSLGAGVTWPVLDRRVHLRMDIRAIAQENDFERNGQATSGRTAFVDGHFNFGFQIDLGAGSGRFAAPQDCALAVVGVDGSRADCVEDSDRDGVADGDDLCPGTRPGGAVDSTGCSTGASRDTDGDGVFDAHDQCPGTAPGVQVDAKGCASADSVVLKGVNFEFNSARLTGEARDILDSVAILLAGPLLDRRIEIAGHTDRIGSADYNYGLSLRRAEAVKAYLQAQGVAGDNLVPQGYGFDQPVASNDREAGRAANRRVVFTILGAR